MEEQKNTTNWLQQEAEELKDTAFDGERLPALKLEENKIAEIEVDFSKPFETYQDTENESIKKIIPITLKGEKLVWWLNVRNPVYNQIVQKGIQGQKMFKILQTGTQKNTRYSLIEEDSVPKDVTAEHNIPKDV